MTSDVVGDVTAEADVERLVGTALDVFGCLDVGDWLASAGPTGHRDDRRAVGPRARRVPEGRVPRATKHEAWAMKAAGSGGAIIINIASINALETRPRDRRRTARPRPASRCSTSPPSSSDPTGSAVRGIGPVVDTPLTQYQRDLPAIRMQEIPREISDGAGRTTGRHRIGGRVPRGPLSWISGETLFVDGASLTRGDPMMLDILRDLTT